MAKAKNPHGIRARVSTKGVIELWLGTPGEAESDCIGQFHKDYLPSVQHVLSIMHKLPVIETGMHYGMSPEPKEAEYSELNGFLKKGATKCPDCNVSLHWALIGGMRLYQEVDGKPFYDAKCPQCNTTWLVRK